MGQDNKNWIPVSGAAIGALIGGIPGAIIGGLLGAIIKEFTCPLCNGIMKEVSPGFLKCQNCGYVTTKQN
jgi:hypothetical protein